MLRCQFLCYVLKTSFFIKIALKLSYFCKKMQNFRVRGGSPPDAIGLRRLEALPPDPKINPPPLRISGYAPGSILGENLFFGLHLNSGKKVFHFWGRPFFALHLICSPEKNRGRGSSPSMLKIGQIWGKIANYPPQCSSKICTPVYQHRYEKTEL